MTIEGAISSALNGYAAFSSQVTNISENLANISTVGFKRVDTGFKDLLMGPEPAYKTPLSVRAQPLYRNDVSGNITGSDNPTSFAVSGGEGFVPVTETSFSSGTETLGTDIRYTRAADFSVDVNYNFVNSDGQALMAVKETGKFTNTFPATPTSLEPVNRDPAVYGTLPGAASTALSLNVNFPAEATMAGDPNGKYPAAGPAAGSNSGDQKLSVPFFDSLGYAHTMDLTLRKTEGYNGTNHVDGTPVLNTWNVINAEVVGAPGAANIPVTHWVDPTQPLAPTTNPNLSVSFDGNGRLAGNSTLSFTYPGLTDTMPDGTTSVSAQTTVNMDFGTPAMNSTQFSGSALEIRNTQDSDGHASGTFDRASIDKDGYVAFTYTNGMTVKPYRIPLATFPNPDKLERISGATFGANPTAAGTPTYSWPGDQGGTIAPDSVESSNVDVAAELTKMIVAQRAYSSNSKVISTGDSMIQTAIGMKS